MQQQQTACQLLRSLAAALARHLPQSAVSSSSSSFATQQTSRLPAALSQAMQRPYCQHVQAAAWQRVSCSSQSLLHTQQQRLLQQQQQHSSSWQAGPQLAWRYLQQQQHLGGLGLQSRSMATRVEQQAAANPGRSSWQCTCTRLTPPQLVLAWLARTNLSPLYRGVSVVTLSRPPGLPAEGISCPCVAQTNLHNWAVLFDTNVVWFLVLGCLQA